MLSVDQATLGYNTFELPSAAVSDVGQIGQRMLILHPLTDEARDALRLIELWEHSEDRERAEDQSRT